MRTFLLLILALTSCDDKADTGTSSTSGPDNALCVQPCLAELDHEQGETACAEEIETCYAMCDALLEGTEGSCSSCLVGNVIGPEAWDEDGAVLCELGYIWDGDGSDCADTCD